MPFLRLAWLTVGLAIAVSPAVVLDVEDVVQSGNVALGAKHDRDGGSFVAIGGAHMRDRGDTSALGAMYVPDRSGATDALVSGLGSLQQYPPEDLLSRYPGQDDLISKYGF